MSHKAFGVSKDSVNPHFIIDYYYSEVIKTNHFYYSFNLKLVNSLFGSILNHFLWHCPKNCPSFFGSSVNQLNRISVEAMASIFLGSTRTCSA